MGQGVVSCLRLKGSIPIAQQNRQRIAAEVRNREIQLAVPVEISLRDLVRSSADIRRQLDCGIGRDDILHREIEDVGSQRGAIAAAVEIGNGNPARSTTRYQRRRDRRRQLPGTHERCGQRRARPVHHREIVDKVHAIHGQRKVRPARSRGHRREKADVRHGIRRTGKRCRRECNYQQKASRPQRESSETVSSRKHF